LPCIIDLARLLDRRRLKKAISHRKVRDQSIIKALHRLLGIGFTLGLALPGLVQAQTLVTVTVDNGLTHQKIEGFGATHMPLAFTPNDNRLSPALRAQAIDAVYGQVKLTTGNVEVPVYETPANATDPWNQRKNDNSDPLVMNPAGFNFVMHGVVKEKLIDLARPLGFDNFYMGFKVNLRWTSPWLASIRSSNYSRYLDECAEQVAAGAIHWRDAHGISPRYLMLFNEPTSGNNELQTGSAAEVRDIIKRAGQRLRQDGFAEVKFVVPGEETEQRSLDVATTILADPIAREFVGAIAYHPYPYGSTYAAVPNILNTSGKGQPDAQKIAVRNRLRDLGKKHGIQVWMTEVSHAEVPALSFSNLLGRAIHIHDEMVYADAAAYFGMNSMWDSQTHREHFGNDDLFSEDSTIALIDIPKSKVYITGMGYAIGHYARWLKRGAIRLESTSSDPLLLVTAFREDTEKRLVLVVINNRATPARLNLKLKGLRLQEGQAIIGEGSTSTAFWSPLPPLSADTTGGITLDLPSKSVTTLASPVSTFLPGDVLEDGRLDVQDAVLVLRSVVGMLILSPAQSLAADISFDQKVDVGDAVLILQKAVGL
jgi:O-glycosyl hydrolase